MDTELGMIFFQVGEVVCYVLPLIARAVANVDLWRRSTPSLVELRRKLAGRPRVCRPIRDGTNSKYIWKTDLRKKPTIKHMGHIDINHSLGRVIRQRRKSKKLSQEALGRTAGVTRNYISLLELGHSSATVDTLYAIARALDAAGSALLSDAEDLESKGSRRPRR